MKNKTFRILLIIYFMIMGYKYSNAQDYSALQGYLTVDNNVWTLKFQNNEYYYLTDPATITFSSEDDVEIFYSDLKIAMDSNDNVIENTNYTIYSSKKSITVYNTKGQYMVIVKKYFKNGLKEIENSIDYMKSVG